VTLDPTPESSSMVWRKMLGHVPATNDRAHIEHILRTYVDSWASGDIEGRLALFSDDAVVEDPATIVRAAGTHELRHFLSAGIASDWHLEFSFERVAAVADEAILTYRIALRVGNAAPAELLVNAHAVFGEDGLIRQFRTFFDVEAISGQ
jgi:steroid Delta-isomerase